MMGELEHATVLNSVLRFWSLNAATTEPLTLSQQCAELASSLQASSAIATTVRARLLICAPLARSTAAALSSSGARTA
jgi:hypothetical protein